MRTLLARLGLAAGVLGLLLVGVLLAILPGRAEPRALSVYSFEPDGLRALYLTAEGLGFPVQVWNHAPAELEADGTLLVLSSLPEPPPSMPAALERAEEVAVPRRGRDLTHYTTFVERGGTLLVLGAGEEELDFLRADLALKGLGEVGFVARAPGPTELALAGGERLSSQEGPLGVYAAPLGPVLVRTEDGQAIALACGSGAGRVVLLALESARFTNGVLEAEPDAALLFVRLLEALGPFEEVLFDEYALGGWRPASVAALAFSGPLAALSLHVLFLVLLLGWRSAWSGPFPRDPEPWQGASPLARARAAGGLLVRAGRFDLLTAQLRRGVLQRWEARSGRRGAPGEETALAGPGLALRLERLARGDAARRKRLTELFVERRPSDLQTLDALERELRAFEAELFGLDGFQKPRRIPGPRRAPIRT